MTAANTINVTVASDQEPRSAVDDHVLLAGRPPIGEFLGFIRTLGIDGELADLGQAAAVWRLANDHVRDLESREAGLADSPTIGAIPEELEPLKRRVLEDPIFQRCFQFVPVDIALVELDRLVVFQKHINLAFVRELKERIGPSPTPDQVFRLCLPFDHPAPGVRMRQTAANGYTFVSPSDDLRFLEAALLKPNQIVGYAPQGPIVGVLGLMVGYGSNFLQTIHVENRLVLGNGSHRAFALRDLGVTRVPCIVQRVSRREELELVGAGDLQQNPDRYLKVTRPPLLKDYFDPALRQLIAVARKHRVVRVSFGVEQGDIPAN